MATAAALAFVQKLYVAYYQRPADYAGQQFWAEKFDKEGGASAIASAFATSAESVTLYGSQALAAQINAVYLASFGRAAETVGLQFYINEINAGRLTTGTMAVAVLNGAVGTDLSTLNSKLAVAAAYTTAVSDNTGILKYVGDASAVAARTFLATVTTANQAASTTEVITQARALVVPTVTTGSTFTLTTATDSITGTAGADTFLATAATTNPTFNAADTINGGAGTDTLNLTIDVLAANGVSGASTSAVEVINFRSVSGNAQAIVGGTSRVPLLLFLIVRLMR
ncbi:DUF4214 domain-containing protein [Iodobacter fluviatilis]|uniref:DUF4214 domain-containing protein n=1 Tax=Iodobacter fluviatilis TaxID=537 RepID=A0A7G3G9L0_9NEIS|nr:DUF4214 domain-containing protein [Iodobacter fluviatilis]QBC44037.1 hypothetical protein C1H71_11185 [Iodobacter fluviatilis]